MTEKGLEFRFLDSQRAHFTRTHFPATAPRQQTSLLSPNLFPPKFYLNFFKDLSMMLAISTSSSPFLSLTNSSPTSLTEAALSKATLNFHVAQPNGLLSAILLDLSASFYPLIIPTFLVTLSPSFA